MWVSKRVILFLWLIFLGAAHASATVIHAPENRIWNFLTVGYDAVGSANIGYDDAGKSSSAYDVAPSRAHTDSERRFAEKHASFDPFGRLLAAKGGFEVGEVMANGRVAGMGPGAAFGGEIPSSAQIADRIAGGHAFEKHVIKEGQYGNITRSEFADHIQAVVDNPTMSRSLSGGRSAHFDEASGTVVIRNPKAGDWGTAFVPKDPLKYFNGLR